MSDKQSHSLGIFSRSFRVWIKWIVLAAFFVPLDRPLRAAGNPAPLDIRVDAYGFGTASSADLTALLQSAASELWRHCPRTKLAGIDVYHRADYPQTNFTRTPSGRIAIGLAAQDTHWAQYSFQFAHEFCHALANYSNNLQRLRRYPPAANFWLEESLCETASLFTLRTMSLDWRTSPPYPAWRGYAPWLYAYAQARLSLPEHQLPSGRPFSVWFQERYSALRLNPANRGWNTLIAIQFLPIFEAEPRGWEAVTYLNRGSADKNESLAQHLAHWSLACPEHLRPFVEKLAAVFAIKW